MITQLMREEAEAQAQAASSTHSDTEVANEESSTTAPSSVNSDPDSSATSTIPPLTCNTGNNPCINEQVSEQEGEGNPANVAADTEDMGAGVCAGSSTSENASGQTSDTLDYGKAKKEQKKKSNQEIAGSMDSLTHVHSTFYKLNMV